MTTKSHELFAGSRCMYTPFLSNAVLFHAVTVLVLACSAAAASDLRAENEKSRAPFGTFGHADAPRGHTTSSGPTVTAPAAQEPLGEAAWQQARAEANRRVREFESALHAGDPARVRRAALDLQSDPLAVHHINRNRPDLVEANNRIVHQIRNDATRRMREAAANEWNRANPDKPPITPDDVEVYQPRNWRDPNAPAKSPQDWDVTIRVRGNDLPPEGARKIVQQSFFDAAGGKQTFGDHATPENVAHRQRIETTSGRSPEAYNEPDKILGTRDSPPRHGDRLKDPEQLTRTIEHKSNIARNEADAARAGGDPVRAAQHEFDQMYQAAKQYERITKPRVEAAGGRIDSTVDEGMRILSQVGPDGISPAEARRRLANMGETPESIIQKAAGQAEAAQVLGKGRPPSSDASDGTSRTSPDAPEGRPRSPTDAPEGRPRGPVTDTPDHAPSKAGKAMEVVGKGMQAVDILAGAQDAKDAIQEGDMGKLRETAINTADGLVGGPLATSRMVHERLGKNREEKNDAQQQARHAVEAAFEQQLRLDLRRSGLTKAEVDAIMEARRRGDDGPLKDAYSKAGKEIPRHSSPDPTWRETIDNYGTDVAQNIKEVQDGIADRAQKAKTLVTQMGKDLAEIGIGLTEAGVAREVMEQQRENWTKDNLKAGAEHLAEKGKEFMGIRKTDREREQQIADQLAGKLIENGVDPNTARKLAGDYITHAGGAGTREQLRDALAKARSRSGGSDRERVDQSREDRATGRKDGERDSPKAAKSGPDSTGSMSGVDDPARDRSTQRGSPSATRLAEAGTDPQRTDREPDAQPRNDLGERVDPSQYRDGERIVVRDGTEYEKRGDRWEKTGHTYESYSPAAPSRDRLANAEPRTASAGLRSPTGAAAGLNGLEGRDEMMSGRSQNALGLMAGQHNMKAASTRGDQAMRDADAQLNAAGRDAQTLAENRAAHAAGAQRDGSLGNVVANGVQQALEQGLTAVGDSFGKAAADRVSNKMFKEGRSGSGRGGDPTVPTAPGLAGPADRSQTGERKAMPASSGTASRRSGHPPKVAQGPGGEGRRGRDTSTGTQSADSDHSTTMATCPGCGRAVRAAQGESVPCPYCVTLTCPRCGYSKNYSRGQEPDSCPMCYTTTCRICGRTGWARRDQPQPPCPSCIRIRCSGCGSTLYEGDRSSAPASPPCPTCTARHAQNSVGVGN